MDVALAVFEGVREEDEEDLLDVVRIGVNPGGLQRATHEMMEGDASAPPSRRAPGSAQALRELGVGAQILSDLGVRRARILSNSRRDLSALSAFRIEVVGELPFPNDTALPQGGTGSNLSPQGETA